MKTVGEILSEERKKRGIKIEVVAEATKIRPRFLRAIEKNEFVKLPSIASAHGFIKNYAQFLGISPKFVLAIFRRDFYEDKKGRIVLRGLVNPLDAPRFLRSPRIGFFLATGIFIVGILFYLSSQYLSLMRGPHLEVITPLDQARIFSSSIEVIGKSESDAVVVINGGLTNVSPKGDFEVAIDLVEGKNIIIVEATNRLGKMKRVTREVFKE